MTYREVIPAVFLSRPNRFIAYVSVDGVTEIAHVKNTGRCRELLPEGCRCYLYVANEPNRKTKYDLIAVEKVTDRGVILINMDSQSPNKAVEEYLKSGGLFGDGAVIRREVVHGDSRFDFYIESGERRIFLEVKGCTLEENGIALFPDAPTERGVKHLRGLMNCVAEGYEAYVFIVIQMKGVREFRPNEETHPEFAKVLREATEHGVKVIAMDCRVMPGSMVICEDVDVVM